MQALVRRRKGGRIGGIISPVAGPRERIDSAIEVYVSNRDSTAPILHALMLRQRPDSRRTALAAAAERVEIGASGEPQPPTGPEPIEQIAQ